MNLSQYDWIPSINRRRIFETMVLLLAALPLVTSIRRYNLVQTTDLSFVYDARVWANVGQAVLEGGTLYASVPDNKPPGWQLIVILGAATPWPYLVYLTSVGVGSAALVYLTARFAQRVETPLVRILSAAFVSVVIVTLTSGFINNKTLAMALLFIGLLYPDTHYSGVAYGASFLVAQQVILAAPIVVWWVVREGDYRTVLQVAATALAIVAAGYVAILAIWGVDGFVAAFRQTILLAPAYAGEASQFQTTGSLLTSFDKNLPDLIERGRPVFPVVLAAALGIIILIISDEVPRELWVALGLSIVLGAALLIRVYRH